MTQDQLSVASSIRVSARRGRRQVDEAGSVKCIAIRVANLPPHALRSCSLGYDWR